MKLRRSPIFPYRLRAKSKPKISPTRSTKKQSSRLFLEMPTTLAALVRLQRLDSWSSRQILTALMTCPMPLSLSLIFLCASLSSLEPFSSTSSTMRSGCCSSMVFSVLSSSSSAGGWKWKPDSSSSTSSKRQQQLSKSVSSWYSMLVFSFSAKMSLVSFEAGQVLMRISFSSRASKRILQQVKGSMMALNLGRQNFLFSMTSPLVERQMRILQSATSPCSSNCEMLTQKVLATSSSFKMMNFLQIFSLRAEKCRNSQSSTHIITIIRKPSKKHPLTFPRPPSPRLIPCMPPITLIIRLKLEAKSRNSFSTIRLYYETSQQKWQSFMTSRA